MFGVWSKGINAFVWYGPSRNKRIPCWWQTRRVHRQVDEWAPARIAKQHELLFSGNFQLFSAMPRPQENKIHKRNAVQDAFSVAAMLAFARMWPWVSSLLFLVQSHLVAQSSPQHIWMGQVWCGQRIQSLYSLRHCQQRGVWQRKDFDGF